MNSENQEDQNRAAFLEEVLRIQREYIEGYEMLGENEAGEEGTYTPTDHERMLITDAIDGLLADDEFVAAFFRWREAAGRL